MPERTAAQEYEWLISREEHRKPIDAFFDEAVRAITVDGDWATTSILELGPGPLTDLRDRLRGVRHYEQADTRPAILGVRALEPMWSERNRLPYKDGRFDHVLAREVFEHVFALHRMIEEVNRVLVDGGRLWFTSPFMFPYHDVEPENGGDYHRLTKPAWERLLTESGFRMHEVAEARYLWGSWQCPVSILGWARK